MTAELSSRQVTSGDFLSGIGTFVGAYICLARDTGAEGAECDYGVITAIRWDQANLHGFITVTFAVGHADIPFN